MSISLDGFIAGPDQSRKEPLEPPYHPPVFVLPYYTHDAITMEGGPRFTSSLTGSTRCTPRCVGLPTGTGLTSGRRLGGRQALTAGMIDELTLDIARVLLGSGERIFDGTESFGFEPVEVLHSPLTAHIRFRRVD
jgi:hypothetical protein